MDEVENLKKQIKKYIDTADVKVVKMVNAMLEVDSENDWWDDLSIDVKNEIDKALKDLDEGKGISHERGKK
ncbi:MAG: hypothetical protein ABI834_11915 [Ginsengibacter sp.]